MSDVVTAEIGQMLLGCHGSISEDLLRDYVTLFYSKKAEGNLTDGAAMDRVRLEIEFRALERRVHALEQKIGSATLPSQPATDSE